MTQFKQTLLTAAIVLATAFTLSCSGDGGGGSDPIKKAKITGVSQKGPFVEGSKAVLYELNDGFAQTGRSFTDIIADNKGTFEIKNIEIASPYAKLEANGYYRNENTGGISKSPISLLAIADVREKDQINVNILTHLEYYRVLNLAEHGKTVKDAKKQAQKEIFAVFGIDSDSFKDSEDMSIFGNTESDAALLAISVLLQGDLSEGEFSQRLTNLSKAIETGGAWSDEAAKKAMAEWVTIAPQAAGTTIKNHILGWGLSPNVPDFEKFVRDYWVAYYCSENNCLADPRDGTTYRLATVDNVIIMQDGFAYRGEDGGLGIADDRNFICFSGVPCTSIEYTWAEAQNICPAGWQLPSKANLESLLDCKFQNLCYYNGGVGYSAWDNTGHAWDINSRMPDGELIPCNSKCQVVCVKS